VITLGFCPPWARELTDTLASWEHPVLGPPDHIADWQAFCQGLMARLKGAAQWYEVWGEPDTAFLAKAPARSVAAAEGAATFEAELHKNVRYWLQDRYGPMVFAARQAAEKAGANVRLLGPAWRHDFGGGRGDLLFQVGVGSVLDAYSFHCHAPKPLCFEGWREVFEAYLEGIDRLFGAHGVCMPLALTEFGYESSGLPEGDPSLVSPADRAVQVAKSTLFALSKHRFVLVLAGDLAGGKDGMVGSRSVPLHPRPMYYAYKHLVERFSRRRYGRFTAYALEDAEGESLAQEPTVWHHGFRFPETGEVLLVAWQSGLGTDRSLPAVLPERTVRFRVDVPGGRARHWSLRQVGLRGEETPVANREATQNALAWTATLPRTSPEAETPPTVFLLKPGPQP
jgi:hypothetical protein